MVHSKSISMNNRSFNGKVAIVTGSSQGIGKATAINLCKQGASVVLNGRTYDKLRATESELKQMGYSVIAVQGDITSNEDCLNLIQKTLDQFGKIDFLINNGSLTMNERISELNPEVFATIFESNSMGAVYPTLAALPHLIKTKGSVIFISSLAGLHGLPTASAYSMGKMALTALWQSMKIELRNTGIHFGICYVSFTQNEEQKRMITANGTLIPVPKRPQFLLQSREKVASKITEMIRQRKSKIILSPIGKTTAFLMRHFPKVVLQMMLLAQKKNGTH